MTIRYREPSESNPRFVLRENEAWWFIPWHVLVGLFEESTFVGRPCLTDRVSGYTKSIQHGTVLADWWNTRKDNTAASHWPSSLWARHPMIVRDFFELENTKQRKQHPAMLPRGVNK